MKDPDKKNDKSEKIDFLSSLSKAKILYYENYDELIEEHITKEKDERD